MEKTLRQQPSNCIKIVLFGPENTGKTLLAQQLAAHYKTTWVPEYARHYAEEKLKKGALLTVNDVLPIAYGQIHWENTLTPKANTILICDTNLLETKVYSEMYYGTCPPSLEKSALEHCYHLYFLTYIDIPWQADGIRDKPHERAQMFSAFEAALIAYNKNYVVLKGNKTTRLQTAITTIDQLLKSKL